MANAECVNGPGLFNVALHNANHLSSRFFSFSELKRRMKADKKAAEKEAKTKEQVEKTSTEKAEEIDEENLDPTVSFLYFRIGDKSSGNVEGVGGALCLLEFLKACSP